MAGNSVVATQSPLQANGGLALVVSSSESAETLSSIDIVCTGPTSYKLRLQTPCLTLVSAVKLSSLHRAILCKQAADLTLAM